MFPIAVVGCQFSYIGVATALTVITSLPSMKVKAGSQFVYRGQVDFTLSGATLGTYSQIAPVNSSFNITAQKVKADNEFVLRQLDQSEIIDIDMQNTVSPFNEITVGVTVIVSQAGQEKVLAN